MSRGQRRAVFRRLSHRHSCAFAHPTMNAPPFGWSRAAAAGLTFRPVTDADLPFLARLYASTRMEELAVTDWSDTHKAAFLQSQFDAQHAHYQKHYQGSDFFVIERAGIAV